MQKYIINIHDTLYNALSQMDKFHVKYLIAVDDYERVSGTLTDGDIRRGLLEGIELEEAIESVVCKTFKSVRDDSTLELILEIFKKRSVDFLPILDAQGHLCNIITRRGLHTLLLQNENFQIDFDFGSLDEITLEHEIYAKPWGFYKTTVLNDMFQSKVIYVLPKQALSLQSHQYREEYWIIINGMGKVQIGESVHRQHRADIFLFPKTVNTD